MAAKGKANGAPARPVVWENPLVPFVLQRRLYAGMVELRMLEELSSGRQRSGWGQEACRAAVLLGLDAGDFSSDVPGCPYSGWLRGGELAGLLRPEGTKTVAAGMPKVEDTGERLQRALGVAWTCKQLHVPRVTVVFLEAEETRRRTLRRSLRFAAEQELAMLFVVFAPAGQGSSKGKSLSAKATEDGVPGIAVDAVDAIALCRVAQESLGRARAGGGPALLECVRFPEFGGERGKAKKDRLADPIALFGEKLVGSGIADQAALERVRVEFRARLGSAKGQRKGEAQREAAAHLGPFA